MNYVSSGQMLLKTTEPMIKYIQYFAYSLGSQSRKVIYLFIDFHSLFNLFHYLCDKHLNFHRKIVKSGNSSHDTDTSKMHIIYN